MFRLNNFACQLLYAICITVLFLNIYELTFLVWSAAAAITIGNRYSFSLLRQLACFIAIFAIAYAVSFFHAESTYNFFRDVAYLAKPIIGLLVGYQIANRMSRNFLNTIIYTGLLIAIGHLIIVFITFLRFHTITVELLRQFCGYFSDYEIYVLAILIFYRKFEITYSKRTINVFIVILSLSSFLYLSRTNVIQLIILFVALKGYFVVNRRSVMVISIFAIAVGLAYAAVYYSNPQRSGKGLEAFLYKVKNAPIEPFKTKINKDDWKDFNDNYRSYENILTVKQVSADGLDAVLFGKGMGSTINLGRKLWTNDGEYIQYIPILHNGFATVFLKSGVLGVFFLILGIYWLSRQKRSDIPLVQSINYLLVGTGLFLIISNWVFMGFYLKMDNKSILIGFLLAYKELLIKANTKATQEI